MTVVMNYIVLAFLTDILNGVERGDLYARVTTRLLEKACSDMHFSDAIT